jgi:hypothetical protein
MNMNIQPIFPDPAVENRRDAAIETGVPDPDHFVGQNGANGTGRSSEH